MAAKGNNIELDPEGIGGAAYAFRLVAHLKASRGGQGGLVKDASTNLETLIGEPLDANVVAVVITNISSNGIQIQVDGSAADDSSYEILSGASLPINGVKAVLDDIRLNAPNNNQDVAVLQFVNL